jgi:hypothetical protein
MTRPIMDEIRRILHNTVRETLSVPRRQILLNFKMVGIHGEWTLQITVFLTRF